MSHEVSFNINDVEYSLNIDQQGTVDPSSFRLQTKRQYVLRSKDDNFECILRKQQLDDLLSDKETELYHRPVKRRLEQGLFKFGNLFLVEEKDETGKINSKPFDKLCDAQLYKMNCK
jgi:hypothetical protein